MTLNGDRAGQFQADVIVDGASLRMLVDTGAFSVALIAEDAERAGIHPFPSDYTQPVNTANGVVMAAKAELREVSLGQIHVRDVATIVLPRGAGHISLLGHDLPQAPLRFPGARQPAGADALMPKAASPTKLASPTGM